MATVAAAKLTLSDFERFYENGKPSYEYWNGEAVQKPMPTFLHGLLQKILMPLLDELGFESASEVTLKIASDFPPIPDVIARAVLQSCPIHQVPSM